MAKGRNPKQSARGIRLCGNRCVICGWKEADSSGSPLVEGAHVREFSSGKEFDDASNIIALCPNHHTEYDAHLFYINPHTKTVHHSRQGWEYEGKDISKVIGHIKTEHLSYAKYQFDEYWESPNRKFEASRSKASEGEVV